MLRQLWILAALALRVTARLAHDEACLGPQNASEYEMVLPKQKMTITVPAVPAEVEKYAYGTDNALVSAPKACASKMDSAANFEDRQPHGPDGMYIFRMTGAKQEYERLAKLSECSCGLVVFLSGTSGVNWNCVATMKMLSGVGYVVVALDNMAMPKDMGLRSARPLKSTAEINATDYWGQNSPYKGSCSGFSMPFCYATSAENILRDTGAYRQYLERMYLIRKGELDYFVERRQPLLRAFGRIFLFGRSEGAMVAGRYYHPDLFDKLAGIALSGWSCEFNYYVSCKEHAKVCEDKCDKSLPFLSMSGGQDEFFGNTEKSVSHQVAAAAKGYGGPITGNCRAALNEQGFTDAAVVVFPKAPHCLEPIYDNAVRSVFADFLNSPKPPAEWPSLQRHGCSQESGVWKCDDPGDGKTTYNKAWGIPVVTSWAFLGAPACGEEVAPMAVPQIGCAVVLVVALAVAGGFWTAARQTAGDPMSRLELLERREAPETSRESA